MSTMRVHVPTAAWRVAVAELPLAAHVSAFEEEAIVILSDAASLPDAARDAQERGARALVFGGLDALTAGEIAALARDLTVPVVIARPRVRADLGDARAARGAPVRAVVVETCAVTRHDRSVFRDAVAWGRILAGGPLTGVSAACTSDGVLALAERGTVPVTLAHTAVRTGGAFLRALALGEERIEFTHDEAARHQALERASAAGRHCAAVPLESLERLSLRRAIDAAHGGELPSDLEDFAHDAALAELLLSRYDGVEHKRS